MNLTKVLPPGAHNILQRERLINRLLDWEDKKLIIIHAQAGQGKSTLAGDYARSLGYPSVWYNMDQEDDNPGVFLAGLGAALRNSYPDFISRVPAVPQHKLSEGNLRQSLSGWVSQVFGGLSRQSLIVFDDFNNTSSQALLLSLFKMLLETTPPNIRFMIISRSLPALEIAGLRSKRAVAEISGNDLKFSDTEVHRLFCSIFGMALAQDQASVINSSAEGWPAGLVLMHEYLYTAVPGFDSGVVSDAMKSKFRAHVFDYLAQEVFGQLDEDLQQFLIRTSVADYLPPALMEMLTGLPRVSSSGRSITAIVNELQKKNLFIAVLDEEGPVIRYHALFRDFLTKKLPSLVKPPEVKKLFAIASKYFKETGDTVRAIDLLLSSGQFEKALHAIDLSAPALVGSGRTQTMIRWQKQVPPGTCGAPWFLLSQALASRFSDPKAALGFYDRAVEGFREGSDVHHWKSGRMLSLCGLIEACFHAGGDFSRIGRAAERAQKLLKESGREPAETRARLLLAAGMAWFFLGKLDKSRQALEQALELFRKRAEHFYLATTATYLTPCALYQGDFRLARNSLRVGFEALSSIPEETGSEAALLLTKAMSALFEGDFAKSQDCIAKCKNAVDSNALESIRFLSGDIEGWLKIAQGRYDEAARLLADWKRKGTDAGNLFASASAAHLLAIAYLFLNKPEKAKIESDYALMVHSRSGSMLFHSIYLIASGSIHLKLGQTARAEKELLTSVKMLQQSKAYQQEANAHLMLALLYLKRKKKALFLKHLKNGFDLGRDYGFVYYALLTAEELTGLVDRALAEDICPEYCQGLLENSASGKPAPALKVYTLGGFRVFHGKTPMPDSKWKSKRAKTLLKILIAHEGQKLPREQAMELLWPGQEQDDLRTSFNSLLHRARKVLDQQSAKRQGFVCMYQEGDLVALNRDLVWTDVSEFLSHIDRAARMNSGSKAELLQEYERAVELYQGDFLPEDVYAAWSTDVRDHLRAQYLRALQNAAELADSMGETTKALQLYEKMFLSDHGNEKACRWLMQRYMAGGQRNEAVRIYERCERALNRDLDLEPEEKTKILYRSIIGG